MRNFLISFLYVHHHHQQQQQQQQQQQCFMPELVFVWDT